jgi:hypothetical protein
VAHCPPALLDNIADVLADLRGWPGIVEKSLWPRGEYPPPEGIEVAYPHISKFYPYGDVGFP